MTGSMLLLCLSFYQEKVDTPTIRFFQDNLIVRVGDKKVEVPLQIPRERPALSLSFRKNKNYAVWDERGLTIRIGKTAKSTRLPDVAVTPKLFSKEEIQETAKLIKEGKRSRTAAALSGAKRIGSTVYFLVRWQNSDGTPWLESLVSVDLAKPTFHPTLLARLPGKTFADKPIDDRLILLGNRISSLIRKGDDWGLATFDSAQRQFEYNELGRRLENYTELSSRVGAFVEKTEYGSRIGGRVDLATLTRKVLVETKGSLRFADAQQPLFALITNGKGTVVRNLDTGAETSLLSSVAMRRTSLGVVVWSPYKSPKRAWLYEPSRWTELANWSLAPN